MKPHWYAILLVLAEREQHGSAIARAVREATDGRIVLWPVTLYGSLAELEEEGLIESLDGTPSHPAGESARKRFFRMTRAGRRALDAETRRLKAMVTLAERRLRTRDAR